MIFDIKNSVARLVIMLYAASAWKSSPEGDFIPIPYGENNEIKFALIQ